jgi:hypothetical protein
MKKRIISVFIAFLLMTGICVSGFAVDLKDLQKGVADFSENLSLTLPFNASLGLNWSEAYIGKLIPSVPPHFGIGISFGFTTMEMPVLQKLADNLGYSLPFDLKRMFLPAYTAEGRIGGLFLPFDVGFKFGYLPPIGLWGTNMDMNYLLVGADLRYALVDHKIWPKVSIGVGVNYLKAGIGGKVGSGWNFSYESDTLGPQTIDISKPEIGLDWGTVSLDFKVQISKNLLIITPYAGLGGSYAKSNAGYSVDAAIKVNGTEITPAEINDIKNYLKHLGLDGLDIDKTGISSSVVNKAFSIRAFGGLSVNLVLFRLDLTGLYSFRDQNFGASLGFRFQL